jgi:hypothetical protein
MEQMRLHPILEEEQKKIPSDLMWLIAIANKNVLFLILKLT